MKRTPLRRKSPLRGKKPTSRKPAKRKKKTSLGVYKAPKWFKALPYRSSDHGNTAYQKRLWRLVSQTYRAEDLEGWDHCPGCGKHFTCIEDGQLGHWLRYSLCKGWMKYERRNLAMICAGCNMKDDAVTLKKIGEALQFRYGPEVLEDIDDTNRKAQPVKMEPWKIVDYAAKVAPHLVDHE